MKTVHYRIRPTECEDDIPWRFETLRCLSKTKVTEEMCLRDLYGNHYLINLYNKQNPEYQVDILTEIEDDVDC